jgi:beta-lactamase superfamily II metal-dependent hydrolase
VGKMSDIVVNMYPAENGDAFLINFSNKANFVIDMGYKETYEDYIKNDFKEIAKKNEKIDLLIISHIDEDHIEGAIEFLKENKSIRNQSVVVVDEIWHNSYKHLQINRKSDGKVDDTEYGILNDIIKAKSTSKKEKKDEEKEISSLQGSTLASYIYGYNYEWNKSFSYKAACIEEDNGISINGIEIKVISPNYTKLKNLIRQWLSFLKSEKYNFKITSDSVFDDAYELYMKNIKDFEVDEEKQISSKSTRFDIDVLKNIKTTSRDKSKSNGASIGIEVIFKKKRMLFLGDCHEDILIDYFKNIMKDNERLFFHLVKIPHHGSLRNNSEWIDLIKAKYYVFSTDNKAHSGHPSIELICKIISSNKGCKEKIFLVFNYKIDLIEKINRIDLKKIYNYEIIYKEEVGRISIKV